MSAKKTKKPMTNKKFLGIWVPVLALATVLVVVANIAIGVFDKWVEGVFGAGTYSVSNSPEGETWDTSYYQADFDDLEAHSAAALELIERISAEGTVLAKNDNAGLPLSTGAKVTLLGRAAADPVYGGSGSGSVDVSSAADFRSSLEAAGLEVNAPVYEAIEAFVADKANARAEIVMDNEEASTYYIGEMPVAQYEAQQGSFAAYADAAIVVIGRGGGEGGDLTKDMNGWDANYTEGQHQLELNKDELDLLALAKANFDTVVVVVNSSTPIEMGPVQNDADVDSVLLIGSPGLGFNAVGQVLVGQVNPSGKTTDIWPADFTKDPTFVNFGDYTYEDLQITYPSIGLSSVASNATVTDEATFVNYQEGIYVGYRYYETAAEEGFINYDAAVVYPFGYGLSYTDFAWSDVTSDVDEAEGVISVNVTVTNNGTVAGKDVVELYYSAPYTKGGIEKSSVVLGAFAKTGELAPGASETVTVTLNVEDMASYDYKGAGAYVLEAGDYQLTVRTDSHNVAEGADAITYTVGEDIVFDESNPRSTDAVAAVNRFDDVSSAFSDNASDSGKILNMSRADFAGTFPKAPEGDLLKASEEAKAGFVVYDHEGEAAASDVEMPTLGAKTDLTLIDMRGRSYDDPAWDELLDSLTVSEMTEMLLNGAYNTAAIPSIAKPQVTDLDGPAGFSSFINASVNGPAYPSEFTIAQTWNTSLGEEMGVMMGNESLLKQVSGWYAPAMNLHRSPFAGRNFEYYSEDPFLSGVMATAVSQGAASKGLYTTLKHFALNDQETNRVNNGVATWANEQAIRELYLKAFELPVKGVEMPVTYLSVPEGSTDAVSAETVIGGTAVMSSFNRIGGVWAGGSPALMQGVLREEWGFEGFAISDFNLYNYMSADQSIAAGTDLTLSLKPSKSFADTKSAYAVSNMRNATKNILFAVANSNAMVGQAPGATVTYTPPSWKYVQWGANGVLGVLILAGAFLVGRRVMRNKA